jgi:MFS family permease
MARPPDDSTIMDASAPRLAPPDRLVTRPFLVVTATAFAFFIYIGMLLPMVPLLIEGPLGAGEFGVGLTVATFAIAAIFARPLIGRAADRYGRRIVITSGAVLAGLCGVLSGQVTELWTLLVLRAFTGVGEAAVFVGAATLIADLSPRDRRAEGASYFSVAVFGGIGVGPILGEWLLADTHFERAFLIAGMFAGVAAIVSLFAPARVATPDDLLDPEGEPEATGLDRWIHRGAVMPGLVLACGVAAFASYGAFIPEYAREVGLGSSGGMFAVYSLMSLLVRVVGAKLPERLGPRRAVTLALSNIMAGMAILALVPDVPALWAASVFMGLGVAFNYPSLMALTVNRASDRDRAMVVSSLTMFFEIGSAVGGLVIGALAQVVGKQYGFLGGVLSCAIGLWILRVKVVPVDAPDAGPVLAQPASPAYAPVAGN